MQVSRHEEGLRKNENEKHKDEPEKLADKLAHMKLSKTSATETR